MKKGNDPLHQIFNPLHQIFSSKKEEKMKNKVENMRNEAENIDFLEASRSLREKNKKAHAKVG